jgi:small subunit ribosomal protein S6
MANSTDNYEMMYILRPDLPEEQVQQEVSKYQDFLKGQNTQSLEVKILGKRRLAYPIKKHLDGIYVQMNYQGDGKQVAPLERTMRLSDEVIRYLTLKIDNPSSVTPAESEPTEKPGRAVPTEKPEKLAPPRIITTPPETQPAVETEAATPEAVAPEAVVPEAVAPEE